MACCLDPFYSSLVSNLSHKGQTNSSKSKRVSRRDETRRRAGVALEHHISNTAKYPGVQRAGAHRLPSGGLGEFEGELEGELLGR